MHLINVTFLSCYLNVHTMLKYYIIDWADGVEYLNFLVDVILCLLIQKLPLWGGLKLDHPHYTHINAKYIGKNFQTKHNVTIGSNHNGLPIIGDNCFVGCGAAILGPITIGNNVRISANTVVVHSVPDNCLVVGNPAYIIVKDGVKTFIKL